MLTLFSSVDVSMIQCFLIQSKLTRYKLAGQTPQIPAKTKRFSAAGSAANMARYPPFKLQMGRGSFGFVLLRMTGAEKF